MVDMPIGDDRNDLPAFIEDSFIVKFGLAIKALAASFIEDHTFFLTAD